MSGSGELGAFIRQNAQGDLLPWAAEKAAAESLQVSFADVERASLQSGILPARYQRNRRTISIEQQLKLFSSTVAVAGCGGLGGYIIEELARLGIGRIIAIDPDVFEEHNLNRQILSDVAALGRSKAETAAERVRNINPAVTLIPVKAKFSRDHLSGADIVADALDTISARRSLAETCSLSNIPLVHGTIAGWYGQVAVQYPGDGTIEKLYCRCMEDKGIERDLGNPSFTPATVASLQVAEICKVLLGVGTPLRNRMLCINLLDMEIEEIKL